MITYMYWLFVIAICFGLLYFFGGKLNKWPMAFTMSGIAIVVFAGIFHFYLEQMFVKRWGGTMSVNVPDGQYHVTATWKDDNLWIENYDPKTNTCIFQEYSRGNVLQGHVKIKNCNHISKLNRP